MSATSLRHGAKRTPEYNTPDLSGDRVSNAWINQNLRNVRVARRPRDRYDEMAAKIEQRQDLAKQRGSIWKPKTTT
jgi:hypothetical protein